MKCCLTAKIMGVFLSVVISQAASAATPSEQPLAKPDLTPAYIKSASDKMRKIFLDFDGNSSKLTRASGEDVLEKIQEQLRDTPIKDPKTLVLPGNDDPDRAQLRGSYFALYKVDSELRPAALSLINTMRLSNISSNLDRLRLSFDFLEDDGMDRTLKNFNTAYLSCLDTIRQVEKNDAHDISGSEALMASGMSAYFSNSGIANGKFDRMLKTLDRYLDNVWAITDGLAKDLSLIEERLKTLQQKTDQVDLLLKSSEWTDEAVSVSAGYELLCMRVEKVIEYGRDLLTVLESTGTTSGKLRAGTLISGGIMDVPVDAKPGRPQYWSRAVGAYRDCRYKYKEVAQRLNQRHGNDPNYRPMDWNK